MSCKVLHKLTPHLPPPLFSRSFSCSCQSIPQTHSGTLAHGHFQILVQGGRTQVESSRLSELRKCSWESRETKESRVCRTEYWTGDRCTERIPEIRRKSPWSIRLSIGWHFCMTKLRWAGKNHGKRLKTSTQESHRTKIVPNRKKIIIHGALVK